MLIKVVFALALYLCSLQEVQASDFHEPRKLMYDRISAEIYELERAVQYHGNDPIVRSRLDLPPKLPSYEVWLSINDDVGKIIKTDNLNKDEKSIVKDKTITSSVNESELSAAKMANQSNVLIDSLKSTTFKIFGEFLRGITYLFYVIAFFIFIKIFLKFIRKNKIIKISSRRYEGIVEICNQYSKILNINRFKLTDFKEYGVVDRSKWDKHVLNFINERIEKEFGSISDEEFLSISNYIEKVTINYFDLDCDFNSEMDGRDYEIYIANELRKLGWSVVLTKAAHDYGVDIIAEKAGIRIVFQCKKYSMPVNLYAVQEIVAGRSHEKAKYAAVVTNSTYAKSAEKLAQSNGVFLLHHSQLSQIDKMCGL